MEGAFLASAHHTAFTSILLQIGHELSALAPSSATRWCVAALVKAGTHENRSSAGRFGKILILPPIRYHNPVTFYL
jgi:hypothetical protein